MHTLMIDKIINEGTSDQMQEMKDWVVCLVDDLKKDNFAAYIEAEKDLHEILWSIHIGEPLALK